VNFYPKNNSIKLISFQMTSSVYWFNRDLFKEFNPSDDLQMMKAHIIGHFGEKDMGIKLTDVKQFQAILKTLSGDHEIYIYPNAGHGFANSDNPNYVKESADSAWKRTVEFLKKNL
jgi:carboxymethylenebutenolidase